MRKKEEIAVIGAGIAGLVTALELAETGQQVTIFEKGDKDSYLAGSDLLRASGGASPSRISRLSGADASNAAMTRDTVELWRLLEKELDLYPEDYVDIPKDERLIFRGEDAIFLGTQDSAKLEKYRKSLAAAGASHEVVDGAELKRRYSVYDACRDDIRALIEHGYDTLENTQGAAGVIHAKTAMTVLRRMLERHPNVAFHYGAEVTSLEDREGAVVTVNGAAKRFDKAVVAAGPYVTNLVPELSAIQPTVQRVVIGTIDLSALGLEAPIPFTKGDKAAVPEGTQGAFYDNGDGRTMKFLAPEVDQESIHGAEELVTEGERIALAKRIAGRLGQPIGKILEHLQTDRCAYTSAEGEIQLAGKISPHIFVNGCDGSGSFRIAKGLARITAAAVLGETPPYPDSEKFSFESAAERFREAHVSENASVSIVHAPTQEQER